MTSPDFASAGSAAYIAPTSIATGGPKMESRSGRVERNNTMSVPPIRVDAKYSSHASTDNDGVMSSAVLLTSDSGRRFPHGPSSTGPASGPTPEPASPRG